jgi:hypothetical protein
MANGGPKEGVHAVLLSTNLIRRLRKGEGDAQHIVLKATRLAAGNDKVGIRTPDRLLYR